MSSRDRTVPCVTALLAIVLSALAVLGVLASLLDRTAMGIFHLDQEGGVAAFTSAGLLFGASLAMLGALRCDGSLGWRTGGLPALLAIMGLDEWNSWHERLEAALGLDWQLVYVPVVLIGGAAWLRVLLRWGTRSTSGMLLILGAAAWLMSQVLEAAQWSFGTDVPRSSGHAYAYSMVPEELLEAGGSACFLLAAVIVRAAHADLQRRHHALGPPTTEPSCASRPVHVDVPAPRASPERARAAARHRSSPERP